MYIWFDFDGTLTIENADYRQAHDEFAAKLFAQVTGVDYTPEVLDVYKKHRSKEGLNSKVFENVVGTSADFWATKLTGWDNADMYEPKDHQGIKKALEELASRHRLSIFTNTSRKRLDKIMGHLGYEQSWFEYLLAGEDVPERKPSVVAYEYIVSMSKLKPVDNYYLGDRVSADIMPAQYVGMNTILVGDQTGVADYTFSAFTEILNIL